MGGKCSPSGGIKIIVSNELTNIANIQGTPDSRTDLYNEIGELIQSRWYGPDGFVVWDRDYKHNDSNHTHKFPHDHSWEWKWNEKKKRNIPNRSKELPKNESYC